MLSTGSIGVGGAAGGRRSNGGGSRLLDSLKANVDGQCSESKPMSREVAACCVLYPQGPAVVREEVITQEVGSSPRSVGLSSSHELKADGGSLKCSHCRRQRQSGLWCNLVRLGWGWSESGSLVPKLSHHHGLTEWAESGFIRVGPIILGDEIFTYVTMYVKMPDKT